MGRIKVLMNITADGRVDAQHTIAEAEYYHFILNLLSDVETIAFGRHTFELFQQRWPARLHDPATPEAQRAMAQALNDVRKVVFSSTLKTAVWNNTTIVSSAHLSYADTIRKPDSAGMLTVGSPTLVSALTAANLVDDYYFCIQPVIAGNDGVRLFDRIKTTEPRTLTFVDSVQLGSGVHIVHYRC